MAKARYNLVNKLKAGIDPLSSKTVQDCLEDISIPHFHLEREMSISYRSEKLKING